MKGVKTLYLLLAATLLLLTSCLKSSNDSSTTLYNDAGIVSFSLGTLERSLHTTSSTGEDSIYTEKVDASGYTFVIDQLNHRIYNPDSLPMGVQVERVVCAVTTYGNGVLAIKKVDSDTLVYYSSSDSIDFTTPREFRAYASDGSGYHAYTVTINVHEQDGDIFEWKEQAPSEELAALEAMRMVMLDEKPYVFGKKAGKAVAYTTSDGNNWDALVMNVTLDEDAYKGVQCLYHHLLVVNGGTLLSSQDGKEWTEVASDIPAKQLIAANSFDLYALDSEGRIVVSYDFGESWEVDELDEDVSWLPSQDIASCYVNNELIDFTDFTLLAGTSPAISDIASVWHKISDWDLVHQSNQWVYVERTDHNRFALPQLKNLALLPYDDVILAFGHTGTEFAPFYQSRDYGLTWQKSPSYKLPATLEGSATSCAAATDGISIWIVCGTSGQVWCGRLNRMAWDK